MLLIFYVTELTVLGLLMLAETRWAIDRTPAPRWLNMQVWLLYLGAATFMQPVLAPLVALAAGRLGGHVFDLGQWPFLWGFIAFALAMDCGEYIFHRAQHSLPWLWRMHALHHSDPNMNVTTTVRHYWAEPLLKSLTIWALAGFVFQPTPAIAFAYAIFAALNFLFHANLPLGWGRLSPLLNSPAYHRIHHSREPADYNINFAAIFPLFDLIGGTYRRPRHTPATGLAEQPDGIIAAAIWPWRYHGGEVRSQVVAGTDDGVAASAVVADAGENRS